MKIKFILAITFIIIGTCTYAQKKKTSKRQFDHEQIKNLKVGDQVPDLLLAKIINNVQRSAKISDFRNQLLILDFWDTYCGSCIEALPKLSAMQQKFGKKIKILPVTYQKEAEVTKFFSNSRFLNGLKPACVVEDNLLRKYFKHQIISHVVWIYKGTLKALTTTEYVNSENIQDVLEEKPINWPVKNDNFGFDPREKMFSLNDAEQYSHNGDFNEFSGITGYREGIDVKRGIAFDDDTIKHVYRTSFMNRSIIDAYKGLLFQLSKKNFILTPGRLILEVKDSSDYIYNPKIGLADTWRRNHEFCYEMVNSKPLAKETRLQRVITDLNLKLNLNVRWEKRMVNCIVMYRANESIDPDTVARPSKIAMSIAASAVPLMAFDMTQKYPPAVDETGYNGMLHFNEYSGSDDLRRELQRYGFDFKEAIREIDVLVITENK